MRVKDGGPAFPHVAGCGENVGMSLRDYFAAAALQGHLANPEPIEGDPPYEETMRLLARSAYEYADAMLAVRERKP